MNRIAWALGIASLVAGAATARADQAEFDGMHSHTHRAKDGFCYIEVAHVHARAPRGRARVLYRVRDDRYYFVADPVGFGYDGPRYPYYGHHPVYHHGYDTPAYCYLDGPHFHATAPAGDDFVLEADAYWYVGELSPAYIEARPRLARVNAIYRPIDYPRPEVVFEAPPAGYVGPYVEIEAGSAAVTVEARAEIAVPAPRVRAGFSLEALLPGVVVVDGHGHAHHGHCDHPPRTRGHHKKYKKYKKHKKHKRHRLKRHAHPRVEVRDHRRGETRGRVKTRDHRRSKRRHLRRRF